MASDALQDFVEGIRRDWGPLTTQLVATAESLLRALVTADPGEPWLHGLHRRKAASEELYRDPEAGFVLLAHTEPQGLYRPPHDHGRSWVAYAVQDGEVEMRTFARVERADGLVCLVQRNATIVKPGDVQIYLPGDIHDTRCLSPSALLFRFTERDLRVEDRQEKRVTRYQQRNDCWMAVA